MTLASQMATVSRASTTANSMLENGKTERHVEEAGSSMKTAISIRAIGRMTWLREEESTGTQTEISTMVLGRTT